MSGLWTNVVYLLIPTSNHNHRGSSVFLYPLYIFWFLHQTTTEKQAGLAATLLYIFWFLHQTTTNWVMLIILYCCISFDSYIKPQLYQWYYISKIVVYLLIPTSNHNRPHYHGILFWLYIFWFLHQTTTEWKERWPWYKLYIFWFLHQTTTEWALIRMVSGCISFDSYIKPQLLSVCVYAAAVVYLLIPTSNHNIYAANDFVQKVVYLLIPTSNHNSSTGITWCTSLYIFWFLHQTTTCLHH